uniref:G-protein coupled receptors family 1 profile domain-containing protein n=1 Tax=Anopheles culicifacies TaxID=139723 RepID=A0A182LUT2_9DIPT
MCSIDNTKRIATFLEVPLGKVGYNSEKILTRTKSASEPSISGFSTIVQSLIRESNKSSVRQLHADVETECQILQWLDYAVLFVAPSNKDKHTAKSLLEANLQPLEKENFLNVSRWFHHLQQLEEIRQGNVTTLLALGRNRPVRQRRRQPTTAFVMSLATADLLFCVAVMPLMALRYGRRRWPFISNSLWCRLFPVALYGTVATSVLSLVALTVNRYVLIVHPSWYGSVYRTPGMVPFQLAICWAIPYGLMALPLFELWGRLGFDRRTFSCTVLPSITSAGNFSASPKKFIFIVGFALPFCAIVLCYTAIIGAVRRQRRNMQRYTVKPTGTAATPTSGNIPGPSNDDDERHLTRTTAAIFGCFMLCFLPLTIANVLLEDAASAGEAGDVHVLASILTWHSAVLNPFIYALGSRHYRLVLLAYLL